MKLKKFEIREYWAELYMCIWIFKQIKAFSENLMKEELSTDEYSKVKGICITDKKKMLCAIIAENCNENEYNRVLTHEVFHWIHYLFDYLGIDLSYNNTEWIAYYIDYYSNEIQIFLWNTNKQKNRAKRQQKTPDPIWS